MRRCRGPPRARWSSGWRARRRGADGAPGLRHQIRHRIGTGGTWPARPRAARRRNPAARAARRRAGSSQPLWHAPPRRPLLALLARGACRRVRRVASRRVARAPAPASRSDTATRGAEARDSLMPPPATPRAPGAGAAGPPRRQAVTPSSSAARSPTRARVPCCSGRAPRASPRTRALRAYDARSYQRLSVSGVGLRRFGRDRLLFRGENAGACVRWSREHGAWIEPTARGRWPRRSTRRSPSFDMGDFAPLPYFPARDALVPERRHARGARRGGRARHAASAGHRRGGVLPLPRATPSASGCPTARS
jgi:hypothetical protein